MVVKVIKRLAELFEEFRITCVNCGADLLVTDFTDLKVGEFGGVKGESGDIRLYITCPECSSEQVCAKKEQDMYLKKILAHRKKK